MRTIVDIPTEQLQQLTEICRREDLSRAEAVRRAIAEFLEKQPRQPDNAFGLWKGRVADGLSYQQALRDEWGE
jgi:metal-responsive CopG/Arc/MetJ family transcriptional regulator